MREDTLKEMSDIYERYLSDESSKEGFADYIVMPGSEEEAASAIAEISAKGITEICVQGALTGLFGCAVPSGGCIINMSRMNKIIGSGRDDDGNPYIDAEPGVTLDELEMEIAARFRGENLCWPPAPSEKTATIGGVVASGAFGMNIAQCGDASDHVEHANVVTKEGDILKIAGDELGEIRRKGMGDDAVCITALRLRLRKKSESVWGIAFFLEDEKAALALADDMKDRYSAGRAGETCISAMEFLGRSEIELVEASRNEIPALDSVPLVDACFNGIIYVEIEGSDDSCEEAIMEIAEVAAEYGADPDKAWALVGQTETEKFHSYRHALTEAASLRAAAAHSADSRIHLIARDIRGEEVSFSTLMTSFKERFEAEDAAAEAKVYIPGSIMASVIRPLVVAERYDAFIRAQEIISEF